MNAIQAFLLGVIQGLTEFLPVSSSGHLELGKALLGVDASMNITFTVVVHGATLLATLVVFSKEIGQLIAGTFQFRWNNEMQYLVKILISMIPVVFVGLFLEQTIEQFFTGDLVFVGAMLWVTALILLLTWIFKNRQGDKPISYGSAFAMGIAQAIATLPGISRTGSTIATGLLMGNKKGEVTQFSFLMVLVPIIGANVLELMRFSGKSGLNTIGWFPLAIGFFSAFLTGWLACAWMVRLVKRGKLVGFAVYCMAIGSCAIALGLFGN